MGGSTEKRLSGFRPPYFTAECDIRHRGLFQWRNNTRPRRYSFLVATFGVTMNFESDAAKNRSNIRKHGFDLADAAEMFQVRCSYAQTLARNTGRVDGSELA